MFRAVSPTNMIRNTITQLKWFGVTWSTMPSPSSYFGDEQSCSIKPVYIIGKELLKNEINIYNEIINTRDLRERLMNYNVFPCQKCPKFKEHVSIEFSNYKFLILIIKGLKIIDILIF